MVGGEPRILARANESTSITTEPGLALWLGVQKQFLYKLSYVQHAPTRVRVHTCYQHMNNQSGMWQEQGRILIGGLGRALCVPTQ